MTIPGGTELFVILFIVLLLFGAKKLPDLAGSIGTSLREFKKATKEAAEDAATEEAAEDGPRAAVGEGSAASRHADDH